MSLRRPPARSFRSGLRLRRRPKRLAWRAFSVGTGTLGPDSSERLVLLSQATLSKYTLPTVMRIRGEVFLTIDVASIVGDQAAVYFGIQLQDATDGAAGATFENPFDQSFDTGWMWWDFSFLYKRADDGDSATTTVRHVLDVRSKRRADDSQDLVCVVVNTAPAVQPASIGFVIGGRVLLQES